MSGRNTSREEPDADLWYCDDRDHTTYCSAPAVNGRAEHIVQWSFRELLCFEVLSSPIHRLGVFTRVPIPVGAHVLEYVGERVTKFKSVVRDAVYDIKNMDVYMFQLQKESTDVIDATIYGGPAKYVNHSCQPNVEAVETGEWVRTGPGQSIYTDRVWYKSLRDIRPGEEILVKYPMTRRAWDPLLQCHCLSSNCRERLN